MADMGPIDFRRHFLWLGGAALAWLVIIRLRSPWAVDRALFLFGASGALHATAIVLALRARPSWIARLAFIALAAAVSIGAYLVGLAAPGVLGFHGVETIFAAFGVVSAVGAAAYWLLVRVSWLPDLPAWSVLSTVGACVLSTAVAMLVLATAVYLSQHTVVPALWWFASAAVKLSQDTLVPVLWWFAFSASLAWRRRAAG